MSDLSHLPSGYHSGGVLDLFGNQWWFGTRNEEISSEELAKRMR